MKNLKYLLCLMLAVTLVACGSEEAETGDNAGTTNQPVQPQTVTPLNNAPANLPNQIDLNQVQNQPAVNQPAQPQQVNVPPGPDGVAYHYVCADKCAGGQGQAAGPCPVCGKAMAHNQGYHAAQQQNPANPTNPAVQPNIQGATPPTQPQPVAAQNAKGEWHYKCAQGHPGSGTAGKCGTCGADLAHNAAYHQQ